MSRKLMTLFLIFSCAALVLPHADFVRAQESADSAPSDNSSSDNSDSNTDSGDNSNSDAGNTDAPAENNPETSPDVPSADTTEPIDVIDTEPIYDTNPADSVPTGPESDTVLDQTTDTESVDTGIGGGGSGNAETTNSDDVGQSEPVPVFESESAQETVFDFPLTSDDLLDAIVKQSEPDFKISFRVQDFVIRDSVPIIIFDLSQTISEQTTHEVVLPTATLNIPESVPEQIRSITEQLPEVVEQMIATPAEAAEIDAVVIPIPESTTPAELPDEQVALVEVTPEVDSVIQEATTQVPEGGIVPGMLEVVPVSDETTATADSPVSELPTDTVDSGLVPVSADTPDPRYLSMKPISVSINGNPVQFVNTTDPTGSTLSIVPDISMVPEQSFVVDVVAEIDGQESTFQIVVEWLPAIEVTYNFDEYHVITRFETTASILRAGTDTLVNQYAVRLDPDAMALGTVISMWNNNIVWRSPDNRAWSLFNLANGSISSLTDDSRVDQENEPDIAIVIPVNTDNIPPTESLPPPVSPTLETDSSPLIETEIMSEQVAVPSDNSVPVIEIDPIVDTVQLPSDPVVDQLPVDEPVQNVPDSQPTDPVYE